MSLFPGKIKKKTEKTTKAVVLCKYDQNFTLCCTASKEEFRMGLKFLCQYIEKFKR